MDHLRTLIRRIPPPGVAWLLVTLLILAASGGRICWCHGAGGAHAGSQADAVASSHHGHGEGGGEHRHGGQDDDCECAGAETPAIALTDAGGGSHPAPSTPTAAVAFQPNPPEARFAVNRSGIERSHSPPLFVVNCTFRC